MGEKRNTCDINPVTNVTGLGSITNKCTSVATIVVVVGNFSSLITNYKMVVTMTTAMALAEQLQSLFHSMSE